MSRRPTALRPAALCLTLMVLLGALAGCGGIDEKKSSISAPELFYLRPPGDHSGPTKKVPFHLQAEDVTARSGYGTKDHLLTVDVTGSEHAVRLRIEGMHKDGPRCAGDAARVVCHVSGAYDSWSDLDRVYPFAAPGSEPGDSGVVRFTFSTQKGKQLSARTRVVVGEPVVKMRTTKVFKDVEPGSVLRMPLVIRNTGEVPVRGVGLEIAVQTGLRLAHRYGNCRYPKPYGDAVAVCRFPDLRIAPGRAVVLHPGLAMSVAKTQMYASFHQQAWALDMGPAKYSVVSKGGDLGDGPQLTVGTARTADLTGTFSGGDVWSQVHVDTHADFEVLPVDVHGARDSEQTVHLKVRNNGPADPGGAKLLFTPPPGTTVVEQPMEAIDEDVYEPYCKLDQGTYSCVVQGGLDPGKTHTFDFTLRLGGSAQGSVRVADIAAIGRRDPDPANDTAPVTVLP